LINLLNVKNIKKGIFPIVNLSSFTPVSLFMIK